MITGLRYLAVYALLFASGATAAGTAIDGGAAPADAPEIWVSLDNGRLTLDASNAPLHEVMREIGALAGFDVILVGSFAEPTIVDASFENLSVHAVVERLVRAENRIIGYASSDRTAGRKAIAQIWLLESGSASIAGGEASVASIELGRKEDIIGYKLARLTEMLQHGENALIRGWAATALGTFEDERAVQALESALTGKDSSLRLQAIDVLGRINSERASLALRNLLESDDTVASERAAAIRALARHDTATARSYLAADEEPPSGRDRTAPTRKSLAPGDAD